MPAITPRWRRTASRAARRYAEIAPAAPHALHMPAHIYARLGLWQDDIRSNLASKAASEVKTGPRVGAENRLHAMEFLEYAYLQTGHDKEARSILREALTVKASDVDPQVNDYYPSVEARYPALLAIETHDWAAAARLQPVRGAHWFIQQPAILAHAIAAAHMHDAQAARDAVAAIDALIPKGVPELQAGGSAATVSDEIHAWSAFTQGDIDGAIARLRPVADRQAQIGKGEVELPAREMLAEMESMAGRTGGALQDYQASLVSDPNRYNGLLGAAQAAEKLGQTDVAAGYYRTLLQNCAGANGAAVLPCSRMRVNSWRVRARLTRCAHRVTEPCNRGAGDSDVDESSRKPADDPASPTIDSGTRSRASAGRAGIPATTSSDDRGARRAAAGARYLPPSPPGAGSRTGR